MTLYLIFLISVSVEKLEFKHKGRLQNEMLQCRPSQNVLRLFNVLAWFRFTEWDHQKLNARHA